jgi:hypothetical protein
VLVCLTSFIRRSIDVVPKEPPNLYRLSLLRSSVDPAFTFLLKLVAIGILAVLTSTLYILEPSLESCYLEYIVVASERLGVLNV